MARDEIARAIAERLAQHLPDTDLGGKTEEELIAAMKYAAATRQNLQIVVGQVAAELYRRHRHDRTSPYGSWRKLADLVDMDHVTLRRWAQPYLQETA